MPTAGCRAFDYRPAPNQVGPRPTPLGEGETHVQQITGGAGNCTGALAIPSGATAVAMNVTAVGATAQTNLRLFSADLSEVPLLSSLNVSAGQPPIPNQVDVQLSPGGAIKIFNFKGNVSVIGDIVGYYTDADIEELRRRLPTVTERFEDDAEELEESPNEVLTLDATAPVGGTVMVQYTANALMNTATGVVVCGVFVDGTVPTDFTDPVPGASVTGAPGSTLKATTLTGSRTFPVNPGTTTFVLACAEAATQANVQGRNLVATVIPGPPSDSGITDSFVGRSADGAPQTCQQTLVAANNERTRVRRRPVGRQER